MKTIILKRLFIIFLITSVLYMKCGSPDENKKSTPQPFETAEVYFEQNSTDGDAEVVFKINGGDEGITKLLVTAPDDHIVIDFDAPDPALIKGIRQFQLESPEPEDIEAVKQTYPSGIYVFSGIASDGTEFLSEVSLSHVLPPPADIKYPANEAENINVNGLEITWTSVDGVKAYIIELENEDSNEKIEATLQNSVTSFLVPGNFLQPDSEYKIVIGTMSENGNLNFIETTFSTEEK